MATATGHRMESNSGMGPRKTMIIMVTVVGCVAILWPKVFYPMMVGNGQNKNVIKDHRGAGCCGVVLDQETFANASINYASSQQQQEQQNLFRKRNFAPYVDIDSIRQERPPHLRPEAMHPAMRERGRAIPQPGSIHGGDRPQSAPRIVEGRPGPIPGMRPPMGAGSHQATKSANSMGFIMPLYTIGIVSFFIYTIMKLIFKKTPATPYTEVKPDPVFRNELFTTEQYIKRPDDGTTKLDEQRTEVTAGQGSTDTDASDAQGTTSTVEQSVAVPEPESGSTTTTTTTTIGQVPTSVSNVTNPKFLTLNLANYSTSVSSGNNSKSSSLSIANLSQSGPSLAGGDSADQLMELELLRKKLDETERAMTKIIANMGNIPKGQETNVNGDEPATEEKETTSEVNATEDKVSNGHAIKPAENAAETTSAVQDTSGGETSSATSTPEKKPKKRDTSTERGTVKVMAMEVTAQRENGKRLSRPSTPLLPMSGHSDTANAPTEEQETRSIVLDGRLPHDSKILVSDAETAVEKMEPENSEEEDDAPVILSGKMTLSLINMDFIEKDATGSVAVGEIVTELHKPQEDLATAVSKESE
ncbi:serine-rich adhesin for platelets isoform X7 [Anopheles gambiae]|uniref:serine-rich adhesin for platelets isoform X7 n=1 Tax=Anopheles gambiae TaxID=7165 RepID=UPI002AC8D276|nr:serine-rich adhesin for platelets isoform X7 [Anopheles gambiae]